MLWIEIYSPDQAPPRGIEVPGVPGAYGAWEDTVTPSVNWVNANPTVRRRRGTWERGAPDVPDYAIAELFATMTAQDLETLSDAELDAVWLRLVRSPTTTNGGRWSTAAVSAVRAEYDRRGFIG